MTDGGPHLAFQLVPEPRVGKNRLHLDIRVSNRAASVAHVVSLGGSLVGDHEDGGHPAWTVMGDPEGNEFCIHQARSSS
jgi:predicted enzyme related to lactoylglutathione lyase